MSTDQNTPLTTSAAWLEWKKACTIGRCSSESARQLAAFARLRLSKALYSRNEQALAAKYGDPSGQAAWLELEKHLYAGKSKLDENIKGKRYKDLLVKTCGDSHAAYESVVTRIIQRDVLRKILHEEHPDFWNASGKRQMDDGKPRVIASLDAPITGDEKSVSLYECLAGSDGGDVEDIVLEPGSDEDARKIDEYVSESMVEDWWHKLDNRTRIIISCRIAGKSAAEILESGLLECKKTQIYEAQDAAFDKIRTIAWEDAPNERTRIFLTGVFLQKLKLYILKFINLPENESLRRFIETGSCL